MRILLILLLAKCVQWLTRWVRGRLEHRKLVGQLKKLGCYGGTVRLSGPTAGKASYGSPQGPFSDDPDGPVPFGYKTGWLAIRCEDPERVMDAMDLQERRPANWKTGLAQAGAGWTFVSPCLDGFVLAVTGELPGGFVEGLGSEFSEVQYFCTHRITGVAVWTKYADGKRLRDYSYVGESGQVLADEGELTPEERALGFDRFPQKGGEEDCDAFPDEEDVLAIAAAWGVDTSFAECPYPPSCGWLCR